MKYLGLAALGAVYCLAQNNWIQVEQISITVSDLPNALDGFKIAHLSDLHLPRNASNINNIIRLIEKQTPDLIVLTGDIIDRPANIFTSGLEELCLGLTKIAKVYAVSGNHEQTSVFLKDWQTILVESGVCLLENTFDIVKIESIKIAVMGLKDGDFYKTNFLVNPAIMNSHYKILLVHRPLVWEADYPNWEYVQPDLIFNGHEHGGQFRIPFVGGVVSHDQGFFPKYTSGLYGIKDGRQVVISRGLGSSSLPLRINNRPHLPIITLIKKS